MCDQGHDCSSHSDVNSAILYGQTLDELEFERSFHFACLMGQLGKVRRFLDTAQDHECLVNSWDKAGYCPLHYAAKQGHYSICDLLLKSGADINSKTRGLKTTALHRAALDRDEKMVQYLLEKGSDPAIVDDLARTYYTISNITR